MADLHIPGIGVVSLGEGKSYHLPGGGVINEPPAAAPPTGAIMNQLQSNNLGADLFNGTIS